MTNSNLMVYVTGCYEELIIGKSYNVIKYKYTFPYNDCYVELENNTTRYYQIESFITLTEYRKIKLETLKKYEI